MANNTLNLKIVVDTKTGQVSTLNKRLDKTSKSANVASKSLNTMGKSLLYLGSAAGGFLLLNKAFNEIIVKGIEVNREFENMEVSLTSLIYATDESTDSTNKWANSQEIAKGEMAALIDINKKTTLSLTDTTKVYNTLFASVKKYGGSLEDNRKLTELVSNTAAASGVELNSVLASIDGLANGTFLANSDFGRFLNTIGLGNDVIKEAVKENKSLELIIGTLDEKFGKMGETLADTYDAKLSNFNNAIDQIRKELSEPIFDVLKISLGELTGEMDSFQVSIEDKIEILNVLNKGLYGVTETSLILVQGFNYLQIGFDTIYTSIEQVSTALVNLGKSSKSLWELSSPLTSINTKIEAGKKLIEDFSDASEDANKIYNEFQKDTISNLDDIKTAEDLIEDLRLRSVITTGKVAKNIVDENEAMKTKIELEKVYGSIKSGVLIDTSKGIDKFENDDKEEEKSSFSDKESKKLDEQSKMYDDYYNKIKYKHATTYEQIEIKRKEDLEKFKDNQVAMLLVNQEYDFQQLQLLEDEKNKKLEIHKKYFDNLNDYNLSEIERITKQRDEDLIEFGNTEAEKVLISKRAAEEIAAIKAEKLLTSDGKILDENKRIADENLAIDKQYYDASVQLSKLANDMSEKDAIKTFKISQGISLVQAQMNAYLAISQAWAEPGKTTEMKIATSIAAGVAGTAQVAAIAMQKPPTFHTGGYISGVSSSAEGLRSDEQIITAQTGEGVLSRTGMKNLDALNSGGGVQKQEIVLFDDRKKMSEYLMTREGQTLVQDISNGDT